MLLAVDVGNTNMEFGVFDRGDLICSFRLGTNRDVTSDEIGLATWQFFSIHGIHPTQIEDVVVASVVPQVMYSLSNAMRKYLDKQPLIIGEDLQVPIENRYDNPREVGADRLVNAQIAYKKYGGPLIIVDFGTATTFDAVSRDGAYLGGAIYPGVKISMDALFQKAAKLPRVELANPGVEIGTNTAASLQVGAVYGYLGVVTNICAHMKRVLGQDARVVATGGLSNLFLDFEGTFDVVDKTITLDGILDVYESSRRQ